MRVYRAHLGNIPGVPGSGDEGKLYYSGPKNTFYIRPLLSRPEATGDLSNIWKPTERQNKKIEEYGPNKEKTKSQKKD